MTLSILPEHDIRDMHQESAVAHIHFRSETGMLRFLDANRKAIRSVIERWSVDYEPILTITSQNITHVAPCASKASLVA